MMKTQSRLKGIFLSYGVTAARSITQLLLTSLYIKKLGLDGYGFYQYIYSIASCAIIFDFGISSVVNKYYIEYREQGKQREMENSLFYCLLLSVAGVLLILGLGSVAFFGAGAIFDTASPDQTLLAKKLLVFIVLYLSSLLSQHFFEGVLLANERYVTLKAVALSQIFIKCILVVTLLFSDFGVLSIAFSDFASAFLCLIFMAAYAFVTLKIKVRFHFLDRKLVKDIVVLAVALCAQSIILYLNTSIDKYIVGRLIGTAAVSMYSIALTLSSFFDEVPTVIQRLYLPQAVKLVTNGATGEELTDFIIQPGRYQFVLCGGIFGAFLLFGTDFITLWTDITSYKPWLTAILLMGASIVPLCQNVGLAILTAMNRRMFRSVCLGIAALLNLALTIFMVGEFGLIGAPIGTFIALIICNNVIMNLYYRKIGINLRRLFREILSKLAFVLLSTVLISSPLLFIRTVNILTFATKCMVYVAVYSLLLWLFGFNQQEKYSIKKFLPRVRKR